MRVYKGKVVGTREVVLADKSSLFEHHCLVEVPSVTGQAVTMAFDKKTRSGEVWIAIDKGKGRFVDMMV